MPNAAQGPWTAILVGHQWPADSTLETLAAGARNRHAVGMAFDSYAESLRSTSQTFLGMQEGATAQDARQAFASGERHARMVSDKNIAKKTALQQAHSATSELRSHLAEIAERGNGHIQGILDSKLPHAEKVAHLVDLVAQAQTEANVRAAACSQAMLGSIQSVLNESRSGLPAREFAAMHGVELGRNYASANTESIRSDVSAALASGGSSVTSRPGHTAPHAGAPGQARPLASYGHERRGPVTMSATTTAQPSERMGGPTTAHPVATTMAGGRAVLAAAVAERPVAAAGAKTDRRLRLIVEALARQEPRLRWSAGNCPDGNTLLTTDLAAGWIPPNIGVPPAVRVPTPRERGEGLRSATLVVTYEPGQYLPPVSEPVATQPVTSHARVENLELALFQAIRTRHGLPRLAHTLAGALCARTSYPLSEVLLLEEHLGSTGQSVLNSYPAVDPVEVGNWQLLACVDALLREEPTTAAYHFGWFHRD